MAKYQTTSISQALNHEKEQVQAVRETLQQAMTNKGRQYAHQHTFTLRFLDDDTGADKDSQHFQRMLRVLNLHAAEEVVLPNKMATWEFRPTMATLAKTLDVEEGRKLVIFHYAGHAILNDEDHLCLVSSVNSKSSLKFIREFGMLWDSAEVVFDRVDIIIILDCCYSAASARGSIHADRTVEIVSAMRTSSKAFDDNNNDPSTVARTQNRTFTSKLTDEIARMMNNNPDKISSFSFAEIVAKMRGTTSRPEECVPELALKLGGPSIRLSIPRTQLSQPGTSSSSNKKSHDHSTSPLSSSSSSISAPTPNSEAMAIFRVHLVDADSAGDEVSRLVEWIHLMYMYHPSMGLELTGVYRGRSSKTATTTTSITTTTQMIFHAPWALWTMMDGLDGWELVCETFGRNNLS